MRSAGSGGVLSVVLSLDVFLRWLGCYCMGIYGEGGVADFGILCWIGGWGTILAAWKRLVGNGGFVPEGDFHARSYYYAYEEQ